VSWTVTTPGLGRTSRQGFAFCPGHVHEDALGIAVPIAVPTRDGKPVVVAALSAIVPVTSDGKAVTAVLAAAARGISRTLTTAA
jgi:DNA-binding IclR family transcriptional regulator